MGGGITILGDTSPELQIGVIAYLSRIEKGEYSNEKLGIALAGGCRGLIKGLSLLFVYVLLYWSKSHPSYLCVEDLVEIVNMRYSVLSSALLAASYAIAPVNGLNILLSVRSFSHFSLPTTPPFLPA